MHEMGVCIVLDMEEGMYILCHMELNIATLAV